MLSENEKEAIKQLKSWREYIIKNKEKVNKANDIEFYLRTVLNLITKMQKENEILKRAFDKQTADMSNNLLELRQKDKQIDLMARAFKQDDVRSVEEIKEYFEELAKEEGE